MVFFVGSVTGGSDVLKHEEKLRGQHAMLLRCWEAWFPVTKLTHLSREIPGNPNPKHPCKIYIYPKCVSKYTIHGLFGAISEKKKHDSQNKTGFRVGYKNDGNPPGNPPSSTCSQFNT